MFKLIEECSGVGELAVNDQLFPNVSYHISRYQAMSHSGMPIPGLHRIEGTVDIAAIPAASEMLGMNLKLKLEDGRALGITLADRDGRVLTEGHGPSRCSCC